MHKMKIVIIDSGVSQKHPLFINDQIHGFGISYDKIEEDFSDCFGHGTAIYSIIRKVSNIAEIINIKLDGIENGLSECLLINALKYIYINIKPSIINLSMGINTIEDPSKLYNICKQLYNKGTIIVSAFDNSGSFSYPAAFDSVIGVTNGENCTKTSDFEFYDDTILNIGAFSNIQRMAWLNPLYIMLSGTSFGCAHVTCQVANYLNSGIKSFHDILNKFKADSIKIYDIQKEFLQPLMPSFEIKNAALFPYNKEMHSLVRFQHLLKFKIADVYDHRLSGHVGLDSNKVLNENSKNSYIIKDIDKIEWNRFDTLILGHIDKLSSLSNHQEIKSHLINEAISNQKKIYSFDDISSDIVNKGKYPVYFPSVNVENVPPYRQGKLYRFSKPILGVFGTSSKQGKFTLQLKIREKLTKFNYRIGQIGSEPSSLLFGMDYVFPYGYNNAVHINEMQSVLYLNSLINQLCIKDYDLIIVGSQSGSVSYDFGNLSYINLSQYFLFGTLPDAIILCVNPYDDLNYIQRTISYIESSIDAKIIAIMVYPMKIKNSWEGIFGLKTPLSDMEFNELEKKIKDIYKISIYNLSNDTHIDYLIQDILNFF